MRRRLLIILASLCAALLLAVATLPFWLGAAAGALGRSRGLTFASYERLGYGRFVLKDVEYRRAGLKVTATRVESSTPLVWGWNHLGGNGSELIADRWLVEVTRRDPAPPPSPTSESGWTPLHTILRRVADYLEKYAPRTRTGAGVVRFPGGELMLASAKWEKRELAVEALEFRGQRANVVAGFPPGQNQIVLRAKADAASLELESRGAELAGKGTFWEQPVTLSARLEPRGWIPAEALVNAENFSLPGTRLKLGDLYAAVRGGARVEWRKDHFAADIQAKGEPVPDKKAPPLELALRGRGDAQAFTIEALNATLPGITAKLTEPVTVERSGAFRGSAARFALTADLAAQPWVQARGKVEGEARVVAGLSAATVLEFSLRARDLSAQQLALAAVEADGRLAWPRLEIAQARITGGAGEILEARGGWDFRSKELLSVNVSGQVRRASLARWLPQQPEFEAVKLEAQAAGPLATAEHSGKLTAAEVKWSGLNPLALAGEWKGRGAAVETFNVKASHAATELALGGAVDAQRLELRTVELKREGAAVLQLTEPATLTWKPALQLSTVRLAGPEGKLDASLTWGETGRIEVAARNVASTWFTELVPTQAPPWRVELLAFTGKWERGPMEFSITAGAAVELAKERGAAVNLAARGDKSGVRIEALRATESGTTVVNATGRLPFVLQPGGAQFARIDPQGALVLDATVSPNAVFWQQLAAASGVELKSPEAALRVAGTWERPEGEARVKAVRVAFDPERFKRELPTIEALDVQVIGERTGLRLDNFAVNIEGQPVRAHGRLPAPDGDWSKLFKDPLAAAKAGADFRLQIPETEVAVFARFLPAFLAPQGRMELDVGYKGGGLDGLVRLRGAATRPLGPLGVLQEVTAEIALAGRKVEMKEVVAKSGGQPITLTGSIELREKALPRFDLALKGENLPFVRQTGLLLRGDLDLKVATQGDTDVARISGVVNLRDSLFLQDVRAFLPRGGGGGGGTKRPPYFEVTTPPLNAWQLAVEVTGSRFLRLRTPVFVGVASARFRLTGTLGEPRALGEVAINEGRVRMPFASFDVKQGSVRLTEANPYEPSIYVRATGRRYDYDLTMEVGGEGFSPSVTFSSNPALDSEQVLLMVMTGSSPREDISQTGSQRVAGLGYFLGSSLLGSLGSDAADADKLSFSSGEKVSKAGRETYDIEYKLSDRWTATGEYNEFDEYNAGFKWRVLPRVTEAEKKKKADAAQKKAEEAAARAKNNLKLKRLIALGGLALASLAWSSGVARAAEVAVDGAGFLRDRELRAALERLLSSKAQPTLDANAIEDAAVILVSSLGEEGFQQPEVEIELQLAGGGKKTFTFDPTFANPLPRPLAAERVKFQLKRGVRSHIDTVEFHGLTAVPVDQARSFFRTEGALIVLERTNAFSQGRVNRGVDSLLGELRQKGYAEAEVRAERAAEVKGAIKLRVEVKEGPRWEVGEITFKRDDESVATLPSVDAWRGKSWTPTLEQDLREAVRQAYYNVGYPDVGVHVATETVPREDGRKVTQVVATIVPGEKVAVGTLRFEGNKVTREKVLRRRVRLNSGDALNPVELERARYRLARLGVFESVDLRYEPLDGATRDPIFTLREGPRYETNLLFGYGSYEQFRGGVEWRQLNIGGRAHQSRLELVHSVKSTSGDYSYTVPELFGESLDGTAKIFGLRRREISFLRQEVGASFTLRRAVRRIGGEATAGYKFESLRSTRNTLATQDTDDTNVNVAAISFGLNGDRRDNPLRPRHGYHWASQIEAADPRFGGEATYQRFEVTSGYHTNWGKSRWIHLGFTHGVITTLGSDDLTLPVNKRFFPGGDNSIRGYQRGEAAPRDADGRFIGAKAQLLLNVELEQALTQSWSVVAFVDALGSAVALRDYPFSDRLYSVGLGLRYQTLIGPVRVEYGRNVNPRTGDPRGTWQFSIGTPF